MNFLQLFFSIKNVALGFKMKLKNKSKNCNVSLPNNLNLEQMQMENDELFKNFREDMLSKDCLWKLLRQYSFNTVLDLGAGEGLHSNIFKKYGKRVTAIVGDCTSRFDETKFKDIELIKRDFLDITLYKKFDLVWASHILEHQLNVGIFLDKIYDVLEDNGHLAITVPPSESLAGGGAYLLLYARTFNLSSSLTWF